MSSVHLEDLAAELAQAAERAGELEAGWCLTRRLQPHGQRERVPAAAAVQPSALCLARRHRVRRELAAHLRAAGRRERRCDAERCEPR